MDEEVQVLVQVWGVSSREASYGDASILQVLSMLREKYDYWSWFNRSDGKSTLGEQVATQFQRDVCQYRVEWKGV